jgi:hypothetical protein
LNPACLNPRSRPPAPAKKLATLRLDDLGMWKIYKKALTNTRSIWVLKEIIWKFTKNPRIITPWLGERGFKQPGHPI